MQILRHGQIAVTMNVYMGTYSEDTVRALHRLGDAFDGPLHGAKEYLTGDHRPDDAGISQNGLSPWWS